MQHVNYERNPILPCVRKSVCLGLILAFRAAVCLGADGSDAVVAAPPAYYQREIVASTESQTLRTLSVEERVGVARVTELVRVPLFFSAGECPQPDSIAIEPEGGGPRLMVQPDDVRRGPDGGVSRMHLWFEVDLAPWQRKRFRLVRVSGRSPASEPVPAVAKDGAVYLKSGDRVAAIALEGMAAGSLMTFHGADGADLSSRSGFAPKAILMLPDKKHLVLPAALFPAEVTWGAGPLFLKVRARWRSPEGAQLEQVYRIDRQLRGLGIEQMVSPGRSEQVVLIERKLLDGAFDGTTRRIEAVPAGLRSEIRAVHGAVVSALVPERSGASLVAVPIITGGAAGRMKLEGGRFSLEAPSRIEQSNADVRVGTLRAFWTATELTTSASSDPDALWQAFHRRVQPLVAVVDEPGIDRRQLQQALRDLIAEMKPIGWRQQAGRAAAMDDEKSLARILASQPNPNEADAEHLVRGAEAAWKKMSQDGQKKLREDEKSRGSGLLDPYHVTYTHSAAAVLEALGRAPEPVTKINHAYAEAMRTFLGRVDRDGYPYIDCFSRALNMQMGAMLFGLVDGHAGDATTGEYYRDLAGSAAIRGVYGRAQRPYAGEVMARNDFSDLLYQAICDFWMRTADLVAGEDLELAPLAYARYTDCVDVMADLYHATDGSDKNGDAPPPRANFWRAQGHTHRWIGWSCSPFIRLLETSGDLTGATEAVRYCEMLKGRWKNWPDLTAYSLISLLTKEDFRPQPAPPRLPRPGLVKVEKASGDAGTRVSWAPVTGAVGYRIYRSRPEGAAPIWLNSPYVSQPLPALTEPAFLDPEGQPNDHYIVTAVDQTGRESRWFPDEPSLR